MASRGLSIAAPGDAILRIDTEGAIPSPHAKVWVLDRAFGFSRDEIVEVFRRVLQARQLVIEDLDTARRAFDRFAERGGDYADHLIVERCRAAGCERVASFNRELGQEAGVFEP